MASPGKFLKKDNNQILNNFLPPIARTASAWSLLGVALVALLSTVAGRMPMIVAFLLTEKDILKEICYIIYLNIIYYLSYLYIS